MKNIRNWGLNALKGNLYTKVGKSGKKCNLNKTVGDYPMHKIPPSFTEKFKKYFKYTIVDIRSLYRYIQYDKDFYRYTQHDKDFINRTRGLSFKVFVYYSPQFKLKGMFVINSHFPNAYHVPSVEFNYTGNDTLKLLINPYGNTRHDNAEHRKLYEEEHLPPPPSALHTLAIRAYYDYIALPLKNHSHMEVKIAASAAIDSILFGTYYLGDEIKAESYYGGFSDTIKHILYPNTNPRVVIEELLREHTTTLRNMPNYFY